MAHTDKLGLDGQVKELTFGETFSKNYKDEAFYTIRYDFKPASVDCSKMGKVEVEANQQVAVSVPHVEGAGTAQTVFKGNARPTAKECLLIIDHNTGEIVLERISQNIIVKKTRAEGSSKVHLSRPLSPPSTVPSRASPSSQPRPPSSPSSKRSPFLSSSSKSPNGVMSAPVVAGSMPVFGIDDDHYNKETLAARSDNSSDSESSSGSSSSSDSDSDSEGENQPEKKINWHATPVVVANIGASDLSHDLELSSMSEDSD